MRWVRHELLIPSHTRNCCHTHTHTNHTHRKADSNTYKCSKMSMECNLLHFEKSVNHRLQNITTLIKTTSNHDLPKAKNGTDTYSHFVCET